MQVIILNKPDHVLCQVKTSKYLLEAKVTTYPTIYSVNMVVKKLPTTESSKLLKRAAGKISRAIGKFSEDFGSRDFHFECLIIERRLNES